MKVLGMSISPQKKPVMGRKEKRTKFERKNLRERSIAGQKGSSIKGYKSIRGHEKQQNSMVIFILRSSASGLVWLCILFTGKEKRNDSLV